MRSYLTHLECSDLDCGRTYSPQEEQHLCSCGAPLLARYDLPALAREVSHEGVAARPWRDGLWRYAELLPGIDASNRVVLGEGLTPLLPVAWLGAELGLQVWIKDESLNPTGTFKARGAALGVSMARALGARTIALPTAGKAGAAWAAYGARGGLEVVVAMPRDGPELTKQEVRLYGGRLLLVDGLISDAGRWIAEGIRAEGWYDAGTFREPYRLEGKKTLGLEIAEQLSWQPPDVILYPTGGGVGLLGLWKAFAELRTLDWLDPGRPLPRLVVVQSSGCAPVVRAWQEGADSVAFWEGASTVA